MDNSLLERWRLVPALHVLRAVADHSKQDPTFAPVERKETTRWHASVAGRDFELLLTGVRFWDTRAGTGGGGAVDVAMHLLQTDFKGAVRKLQEIGL